ncbi:MAG: citrate/2-methylcitrate synthase [Planctomycetota bacterium]
MLHGIGIEPEYFSATFAMSRVGGWIAHFLEQQSEGRLIRPRSEYVGPTNRTLR